jgi:hypothetical protein
MEAVMTRRDRLIGLAVFFKDAGDNPNCIVLLPRR